MTTISNRVAEWKRSGIGFAVVPALAPGDLPSLRVTAKQKPPPAVYEAIRFHKAQIIEVLQKESSVPIPVKVKPALPGLYLPEQPAALPVPQLGRSDEAPPVDPGTAPALGVEQVAMFFPANSGFAVGLVETWKSRISDAEYRQIMRALPDLADGALPLPTQSEEGDLPLMPGQTVPDVNRFVCLTVERIKGMQRDLAAFAPGSGRKLLEGRYRARVIDALALAGFHLEAVAAWYYNVIPNVRLCFS